MSDRPRLTPALGLSAIPAPTSRRPKLPAPPQRPPVATEPDAETPADRGADTHAAEQDATGRTSPANESTEGRGSGPQSAGATSREPDTASGEAQAADAAPRGSGSRRPSAAGSRRATTKTSASADTTRQTTILLPAGTAEWLRDTARTTSRTQVAIILNAIERHHADLATLIRDDTNDTESSSGFGLFPDRPAARAHTTGLTATVGIRTTAANLDVIDRIAESTGARNRSHLIAVALAAQGDGAHLNLPSSAH